MEIPITINPKKERTLTRRQISNAVRSVMGQRATVKFNNKINRWVVSHGTPNPITEKFNSKNEAVIFALKLARKYDSVLAVYDKNGKLINLQD